MVAKTRLARSKLIKWRLRCGGIGKTFYETIFSNFTESIITFVGDKAITKIRHFI